MANSYLEAVRQRVVIYDGAFGTGIQQRNLGPDDFGGPDLETCTFGAFAVPLGEYGVADRAYEINLAAARIAKEVASGWSTPDRPRWVAGSMGPGTKFASLGQISFAD